MANSVSSTTVTAATTDPNASGVVIKRNGVVDSKVSLEVGNNLITVEVTAEDGGTMQTYYVFVNRAEEARRLRIVPVIVTKAYLKLLSRTFRRDHEASHFTHSRMR